MNRYLEIFSELEKQILAGDYLPGDLLPSENQLSKQYHVSRETIRKALVLLLENGYIQKKQGKGSIVLDVNKFEILVSGLTSYKELTENQNIPTSTLVHTLQKEKLDPVFAEKLSLPKDQFIWTLIRQRQFKKESVILDKDYLLSEIVPNLTTKIAENSIYEYIEDKLKLAIGYAQKEITVEPINKEDHALLDLSESDTHVVVIRSHVYLEDTRLFQYTESRHRMDRFRFVDFARRRKL